MATAPLTRRQRRAASEAAILDAAVSLYAHAGPDGAPLRAVAEAAGLTHALVARYFGSKAGLVSAVEAHLDTELARAAADARRVDRESERGGDHGGDDVAWLLGWARRHRSLTHLLVRSALGDLYADAPPPWLRHAGHTGGWVPDAAPQAPDDRRTRLCRYGAASVMLGWLTLDEFLTPAVGLTRVSHRRRDRAMADAVTSLLDLATSTQPSLAPRPLRPLAPQPPAADAPAAATALLDSAIALFADHGPASVSIRDVARHAGVNHGLVHRHFGTKDDLLRRAVEVGSASLLPGALSPQGFDLDEVVQAVHHLSSAPRLIARALVDDVPIGSVRRSFPVMRGLLAEIRTLPPSSRPSGLADPRLASAAAGALVSGSAIWGGWLRDALGLEHNDDTVLSGVADLARQLLGLPAAASATP